MPAADHVVHTSPIPIVGTRSVDVRVAAGRAARARVDAGLKSWGERIRTSVIWRDADAPYPVRRDRFVAAVKRSKWFTSQDEDSELHEAIDELADLTDEAEMKSVLNDIYDLADVDRIRLS